MSIFGKNGLSLPPGFLEATSKVAKSTLKTETVEPLNAHEMVHVQGYGVIKRHQAEHEAHLAHQVGMEHAAKGNHMHAAMQFERAAMFHRALHHHVTAQGTVKEESQTEGSVVENQQNTEPHVGRVQDKYRRELARKMKNKDKDKKDKKEDRYQ